MVLVWLVWLLLLLFTSQIWIFSQWKNMAHFPWYKHCSHFNKQSTCQHEHLSSRCRSLRKVMIWICEVLSCITQQMRDSLSEATTMFVWVSISKQYLSCSRLISSEPENILLSPENPSGDSASHLHCLSPILYLLWSSSKLNNLKTPHVLSSPVCAHKS